MATKPLPDQETLLKLLRYEPEAGRLYWRRRPVEMFTQCGDPQGKCNNWNSRHANKEAFTASDRGYRVTFIGSVRLRAHRVIWCMVHGYWPDHIDHVDQNRSNNKLENLREAGRIENARNIHLSVRNKSGRIGVSWRKHARKWTAQIRHNGQKIYLGNFSNIEDACRAREEAEKLYGYSPLHGSPRLGDF